MFSKIWRKSDIKFLAIVLMVFPLFGCSTKVSTLDTRSEREKVIYAIPEEKAFKLAFLAMASNLPGSPIRSIEGPIRGYSGLWRMLLDTYSIRLFVIPATANTSDGKIVFGYYFEVSGSGSAIITGAVKTKNILNSLNKSLRATGSGVQVSGVATAKYNEKIAGTKKENSQPKSEEEVKNGLLPEISIAVQFKKGKSNPDDIAVIIGNANYKKQGKDIPNVKPAYADAEGMRRYFTQALGVREGNIIYLRDATGTQMVRVFGSKENHRGQLFDWVQPGISRVYVYYSGHGAPGGKEGSAYLVPTDADAARVHLNSYPLATLYRNLGKIPAKSVTVVLEACFSGVSQGGSLISSASPVYLKSRSPAVPPNVTVIAAGAANQMASWEKGGSHSLFTKYFLKGMSGEADRKPYGNGDGKVAWAELNAYLKRTLTYFARRYYGRDQVAQIVNAKQM